jgi:hypothetical protein
MRYDTTYKRTEYDGPVGKHTKHEGDWWEELEQCSHLCADSPSELGAMVLLHFFSHIPSLEQLHGVLAILW